MATEKRLEETIGTLIERDEITPEQGAALLTEYHRADSGDARKHVLAEIGGYIGGVFILLAALIVTAGTWHTFGHTGQVLFTGLVSLALLIAAFIVNDYTPVRRRVASVLSVFASAGATGTVAVAMELNDAPRIPFLVGACVALICYRVIPSIITEISIGVFLFLLGPMITMGPGGSDPSPYPLAIYWTVLATAWAYGALKNYFNQFFALTMSAALLSITGQMLFAMDKRAAAYILDLLFVVAAVATYLATRVWTLLVGIIIVSTVGVGEFTNATLGGTVGVALALLAAGITLIVTSFIALKSARK